MLGEVAGGPAYEQVLPETETTTIGGLAFRCVSLPRLIALKRAASRPKDLNVLAELEALLEEREKS